MTQPPRDITPAVRKRAWADPPVRFWWLTGGTLLIIALGLAVGNYVEWAKLNRAISPGVKVKSRIIAVEGDKRVGRTVTATSPMGMIYHHGGKEWYAVGVLSGLQQQVRVGDDIEIYIDPADPENWTVRTEVPPLPQAMIGPFLVLPVALLCGLIALVGRSKTLKTYQHGALAEATVATNKQTPLAPRSRAIRCSLTTGSRMMEVFVPRPAAQLNEGDSVQVILPPGRGRPLAAAWFEED